MKWGLIGRLWSLMFWVFPNSQCLWNSQLPLYQASLICWASQKQPNETTVDLQFAGLPGIMVISCLLPYLLRFRSNVHFREFSGQIAAIDASCWIHKALSVSISQSRNRERWDNLLNIICVSSCLRSLSSSSSSFFPGLGLFTRSYESWNYTVCCVRWVTSAYKGKRRWNKAKVRKFRWLYIIFDFLSSLYILSPICSLACWRVQHIPRGQQITQPGCLDHFQRCRFSHTGTLLLFEKIWVDFKPKVQKKWDMLFRLTSRTCR